MSPVPTFATWAAIAGGGAIGSLLRALVALSFTRSGWPLATLVVNILGSALLGALAAWLPARAAHPTVVAALTTGLCGGFTTMSTFALETVQLWHGGAPARAAAYALASLVASVGAAAAGYAAAR